MAALVATAWHTQTEVDLGVLQRCGTTASSMCFVPKLPALPAQVIITSCSGSLFGVQLRTLALELVWHLQELCACCCMRGARERLQLCLLAPNREHPRDCSMAEPLPRSPSCPFSPSCLTLGTDAGRGNHLGWPPQGNPHFILTVICLLPGQTSTGNLSPCCCPNQLLPACPPCCPSWLPPAYPHCCPSWLPPACPHCCPSQLPVGPSLALCWLKDFQPRKAA